MNTAIVYFYLMTNDASDVQLVAPQHAAYWRDLRLPGYRGGPFEDRSGGLITFEAPDLSTAEELVTGDPFVRNGLIATRWVKTWLTEEPLPQNR